MLRDQLAQTLGEHVVRDWPCAHADALGGSPTWHTENAAGTSLGYTVFTRPTS